MTPTLLLQGPYDLSRSPEHPVRAPRCPIPSAIMAPADSLTELRRFHLPKRTGGPLISTRGKTALIAGGGFFVGVAAYSYLTTTPQHIEWLRASFVAAFTAVATWLWFTYKARSDQNAPK